MKRLGIDIGSTTVKVAVIDEQHNILFSDYQRHFAKIQETLSSLLKKAKDQIGEMTFAPTVTGSGGLSISSYLDIPFCQEVVCVSSALQDYAPQTDVAIELGGEDAKIIYFTNGIDQRMNGVCAGGTGSFIDQMASLLQTDAGGLNEYAKEEIFDKLKMVDTTYLPVYSSRIAPTEYRDDSVYQGYVRGTVHDETSYALGGIAGHAGLFSTVKDVSNFLQMILNDGMFEGKKILSKATIDVLYTPQVEEKNGVSMVTEKRSLGWINRGPASSAGELTSAETILHTGFTGTNIWVDRKNEVAFVLLSNRVHPTRKNILHMDARARFANFIIAHLDELKQEK